MNFLLSKPKILLILLNLNSCLEIHFFKFTPPLSDEDEEDFLPFDEDF
jgi:hypothetical protein